MSLLLSRRFSSARNLSRPYALNAFDVVGDGKGKVVNIELFDPMKEAMVKIRKQSFPSELVGSRILGSSQGWVALLNKSDSTVRLTNLFHPDIAHNSQKVIQLTSLDSAGAVCATSVQNVSVSTSFPDRDDKCVVAVKFWGPCLSYCRPAHGDSGWTNLKGLDNIFSTSSVLYSKLTRRFYLTFNGGHYIGAWNVNKITESPPVSSCYKKLRFCNFPKMLESDWEMLHSCHRSEHLVNSMLSPREYFLIYWYVETSDEQTDIVQRTKRIMVFRVDMKSGNATYTQDIGDFCIFLGGKTEAFCLSATMYPGLKPNSIYFICQGIGVYHLATGQILEFSQGNSKDAIFWLPPF